MMLELYMQKGAAAAAAAYNVPKNMALGTAGAAPKRRTAATPRGGRDNAPPMSAPDPTAPAAVGSAGAAGAGGPGVWDKVKDFGHGQWGAAKDLASNLRQGLGGAATPEGGAAAREMALGNLKKLAPSLLAGGGLYMLHRNNQANREQEAQQQRAMMQQRGY